MAKGLLSVKKKYVSIRVQQAEYFVNTSLSRPLQNFKHLIVTFKTETLNRKQTDDIATGYKS